MLFVLLIAIIALQFTRTQNFIAGKAVNFLEEKLQTKVGLEEINVTFPKSILLKGIYIEDQHQDTLLYAGRMEVDVSMFALIRREIRINSFLLQDITAHISRTLPDSSFNFDFIPEAFANNGANQKDTDTLSTENGWKFSLYEGNLENVYFTFSDEVSGNDINVMLGSLKADMDQFDLEGETIFARLVELRNTSAVIVKSKESSSEESEPFDFNIGAEEIILSSVRVEYKDQTTAQRMYFNVGFARIDADAVDIPGQKILLDELCIQNSGFAFYQNEKLPSADTVVAEAEKAVKEDRPEIEWVFSLKKLKLQDNGFHFENVSAPEQQYGINFDRLVVSSIFSEMEDIHYSENDIRASILEFTLAEKSGFRINSMKGNFAMDSVSAALSDFELVTDESMIRKDIAIGFPSPGSIAENPGDISIRADFSETQIGFKDIIYFQPELYQGPPFYGNINAKLVVDAKLEGKVKDLSIPRLEVKTMQSTILQASGRIRGLPDIETAFFDLSLKKVTSSSNDINNLLPANTIPENINIPAEISLTGNFKGTLSEFFTSFDLYTTQGSMLAELQMREEAGEPHYNGTIIIPSYNIGKLISQDDIGNISLRADVNGKGLQKEKLNADIDALVRYVEYNQYTYNDITLEGNIQQNRYSGFAAMDDSVLAFTFNGTVDLDKENPAYQFTLDLHGADLRAMNFMEEDLRVSGMLTADLRGRDINDIEGDLALRKVMVVREDRSYAVDSFMVASIREERHTDIKIDSDLITASFDGTINIGDLPVTVMRHFNTYFDLHDDSFAEEDPEPQNFSFNIKIHNTALLTEVLIPDLHDFIPGVIRGEYVSREKKLEARLEFPKVIYSDIRVDGLALDVHSDPDKMTYALRIDSISNKTLTLERFAVEGTVHDDSIRTRLVLRDDQEHERYIIGGALNSVEEGFRLSFIPGEMLLHYEQWNIPRDNYLLFGEDIFRAHRVNLSHAGQRISINTLDRQDLEIAFRNFGLSSLSRMINYEEDFLGGRLDGNILFKEFPAKLNFTSDLHIRNFTFREYPVGDIHAKAENPVADRFDLSLQLTGNENNVNIEGHYFTDQEENPIDFKVNIDHLNLASVQPFVEEHLSRMSGALTGNIAVSGSAESPGVRGELSFRSAAMNINYLNTYYRMPQERIVFDKRGIGFRNFTLIDTLENKARVNGYVNTENYREFTFALDVTTRNFSLLNTTQDDNELYYGRLIVDSDIRIRGDQTLPEVTADVRIRDNSVFTFVVPQEHLEIMETEGIVEFVNMAELQAHEIMQREVEATEPERMGFRGINLSASINIPRNVRVTIVVDPLAGDSLSFRGQGVASFAMDPAGSISLTGRYEIVEGSYQMSFYDIVRRSFVIEEGSSITWLGDPLNAKVDIKAIYSVTTSPQNLLRGLAGEDPRQRQRMPFEVHLMMAGELLQPDISFDITLAPRRAGAMAETVRARLLQLAEQEGELNKQVFALLVLNTFIAEDPLSATVNGTSAIARNSVSSILSQQLTNITDQYLRGVDIDIDVHSYRDYGAGGPQGRTEVELGLSKQLFDQRVTVQVGGHLDVEGERRRQQSGLSDIAGDVSIEYSITADGRLRLRGFRQRDYQNLFEGELIETGVSILYIRNYNRFRELFRREEEEVQRDPEPEVRQ